jgi:hypothetical protein
MIDTQYKKLINVFEKSSKRYKNWSEWLEFDYIFDNLGRQSCVGILKSKDGKHKFVFKLSLVLDFLIRHENIVTQDILTISEFCPHFSKGIGMFSTKINPNLLLKNPFHAIDNQKSVFTDVLLVENIPDGHKLGTYIRTPKIKDSVIYGLIKQTLMGLCIAQQEINFTHYDLHSNNIMVKPCDKNLVMLYKLNDTNQYCVPTYGYYPIIFDYGFAYSKSVSENQPAYMSYNFTDSGIISDRYSSIADARIFLVSMASELHAIRESKKSKIFKNIAMNIFGHLKPDKINGREQFTKNPVLSKVFDSIPDIETNSRLFEDYEQICIEMIQSLIILPLQQQDITMLEKAYKIFIREWIKIENEISSTYYNMVIFRDLIDIARDVRPLYETGDVAEAVTEFRRGVYNAIDRVANFCKPVNVHYEKMLCSLYLISRGIEGLLYKYMNERELLYEVFYKKMPVQTTEQILAIIQTNIEDTYKYNKDTIVLVMDCVKKRYEIFDSIPNKVCDELNNMEPICKGTYLYDLYINQK